MKKILFYSFGYLINGGVKFEKINIHGDSQFCYSRILFYKHTLENFKVISIRTIY